MRQGKSRKFSIARVCAKERAVNFPSRVAV